MKKIILVGAMATIAGCIGGTKIPNSLAENPLVIISPNGSHGNPAFVSVEFRRAKVSPELAAACMAKSVDSVELAPVHIGNAFTISGQSAYQAPQLVNSIPFRYTLTLVPLGATYLFERIRFNEGHVGGPLTAINAYGAEYAYAEMEAIVARIDSCLR